MNLKFQNSPLRGPGGLTRGDVVYKINDCIVLNSTKWKSCILHAVNQPSPGYCVTEKMIRVNFLNLRQEKAINLLKISRSSINRTKVWETVANTTIPRRAIHVSNIWKFLTINHPRLTNFVFLQGLLSRALTIFAKVTTCVPCSMTFASNH